MKKIPILAALMCGALAGSAVAQNPQPSNLAQTFYEGWKTQAWTADPRPYQIIRRSIDAAMPHGEKPEKIALALTRYTPQDKRKLTDPQTRFKAVYAFYRTRVVSPASPSTGLGKNWQLLQMYPAVYNNPEWARLRFLLECYPTPRRSLKGVGERLARLNPKDYDVKYQLLRTLTPGLSEADKQQALALANELVRAEPTRPSVYSARAGVYYRLWLAHRSQANADRTIAAYRQYLAIAPPNAPFRSSALWLIAQVQKAKNS